MPKKSIEQLELRDNLTLVGGAGFSKTLLSRSLALTEDLVAADGGANFLPTKAVPKYIIGDLDSVDKSKLQKMGLNGKEYYEDNLSMKIGIDHFNKLFNKIIK